MEYDFIDAVSIEKTRAALVVDKLMQEASEIAGLHDYGDLHFVQGLEMLTTCFAEKTTFHAAGLEDFRQNIVRDLVNRLRFQNDLNRHPEILDEDVADPIVIMGLPRSGTTKMQRLMGTDPALLKTYMWQLVNPAPFPNAVPGKPDPRISAAVADSIINDESGIKAGHKFDSHMIEEDLHLFGFTFNDAWYLSGRNYSPAFDRWVWSRKSPSDLSNFMYVSSLLQYLQWQQGGRSGRRWLLKSTNHFAYLDELLQAHPKATLVHIHRHPRSNVASVAKLTWEVWKVRQTGMSLKEAGRYWLDRERRMVEKYLRERDRLDLNERILDIQYEQIRTDPMPVIRVLYDRAGHTLTEQAEQNMLQWDRDNEQGKHGAHIYSLEDMGLSADIVDDAFAPYIERFIHS